MAKNDNIGVQRLCKQGTHEMEGDRKGADPEKNCSKGGSPVFWTRNKHLQQINNENIALNLFNQRIRLFIFFPSQLLMARVGPK